jgi:hypothetical protein
MKNIVLILSIVLMSNLVFTQNKMNQKNSDKPKILVYYFHGTHRCPGCLGAEKAAVNALNELYKKEQDNGIMKFESLNLEEPQNKSLVEKYQIGWSTLLFIKFSTPEEKVDLTDDSFSYGRSNPEKLKGIIKATVDKMLK